MFGEQIHEQSVYSYMWHGHWQLKFETQLSLTDAMKYCDALQAELSKILPEAAEELHASCLHISGHVNLNDV